MILGNGKCLIGTLNLMWGSYIACLLDFPRQLTKVVRG